MKGKLLFLLASLFLLVSCATVTPEPDDQPAFGPDRKENALKEIKENKNQNAGSVFRYSVDLEIETVDQGKQKIAAMALWQPDRAIRWRLRYMGYTFFSALGNNDVWLLFLEDAGVVYKCPAARLPYVIAPSVPPLAWKVLSHSIGGFCPEAGRVSKAYESGNKVVLETADGKLAYDELFLPAVGYWEVSTGEKCKGTFSKPEKVNAPHAFEPCTNKYRVMTLQ